MRSNFARVGGAGRGFGVVSSRMLVRLSSLLYLLRAARQLFSFEVWAAGSSFHRRNTSSQNLVLPCSGGPPILSTNETKSASGHVRRSAFVAPKYLRISTCRDRT